MQVTLEKNEVATLLNALNSYIQQLREEIGKTENYDMKEGLKTEYGTLAGLVTKLGGTLTSDTPDLGADNPPWGG